MELWKLKGEAPKVFWKKLRNSKEKTSLTFTNNELSNYFSKLLNCDNTTDDSKHDTPSSSLDNEIQDLIDKSLNQHISIKNMTNELQNGKASGLDMLSGELLKHANDKFLHVFTKLFNKILNS